MPTIIGIPAGKMIRTSVVSDTDDLGFTRLTETYALATSDFATFRSRLINFTPYNTIMNYVYPTSSTSYPYVVIEAVSITDEAGGISKATIQYQGILKPTTASSGDTSWLPPAKQKIQPHSGLENPVSVIVDFMYYSDNQLPEFDMLKKYGTGTILPSSINGTNLYKSIKAPYYFEEAKSAFQNETSVLPAGAPNPAIIKQSYTYYGMLCVSNFSERAGLFLKITNTYQDCAFIVTSAGTEIVGVLPSSRA